MCVCVVGEGEGGIYRGLVEESPSRDCLRREENQHDEAWGKGERGLHRLFYAMIPCKILLNRCST